MYSIDILRQLSEDYETTWAAFNDAQAAAKDILSAIRDRQELERAQTAERIFELEALQVDENRADTVRRIAGVELKKLQERTHEPTVSESEAFESEIRNATIAVADLRRIRTDASATYDAAMKELETFLNTILRDQNSGMEPRWIDSLRKDFIKLGGVFDDT